MKENKRLVLLWALCAAHVFVAESRLLPRITSFDKQLSFNGRRIILSSAKNAITDNESFLYATCSSQEETFKENRCNVTLETPAFDGGATYRDFCMLQLAVTNPNTESFTDLRLQPFGDDGALLSWLVKDHDWNSKYAVVRILPMSSCKYVDLVLPADKLQAVLPNNQNGFDVVVRNKTFCGTENCRLSFDAQGKKIGGPTQFLANVKFHKVSSLVPASRGPIGKGQPQFYALVTVPTEHRLSLLQVGQDGKGTEILTVPDHVIIKLSNSHDLLSACWASERTNVTCRQFDSRANKKLGVVLEFIDEPGFAPVRWVQPHNFGVLEPGLLLVTGQMRREDDRKFTSFSLIRIHSDGHRDRPLEVEGLEFKCTTIRDLHVDVSENDPEDELCIHFACENTDYGERGSKDSLKFGSRCIPRRHVTLAKRHPSVVN
ncbi:hypothetical protein TSAR_008797 [Trichomalopsis sarcophagae]|uniref:Uncharacterized protein n=1 Tax=Trichomalopsis sarcophagae TaxID=543379 RepID=A0A232F7Z3_9HYME|nr:hypothetical protein TSAR_008797 [Trichomalopsis sarcophagae]